MLDRAHVHRESPQLMTDGVGVGVQNHVEWADIKAVTMEDTLPDPVATIAEALDHARRP